MLLLSVSGGKWVGHGLWLELVLKCPGAKLAAWRHSATGGEVASRKPRALPVRIFSFSCRKRVQQRVTWHIWHCQTAALF